MAIYGKACQNQRRKRPLSLTCHEMLANCRWPHARHEIDPPHYAGRRTQQRDWHIAVKSYQHGKCSRTAVCRQAKVVSSTAGQQCQAEPVQLLRRCRATVQVPLGIAVRLYCLRPCLAGRLLSGCICHVDNFLPLYASLAVACVDLRSGVDRFHAWHVASGSLPAFHDRLTTRAVFVADFGMLCFILSSRFVDWQIRYGHLLVYSSKFWQVPAKSSSDSGKACFLSLSCLQRAFCKTRLVYTKHCSSPRIKMSFGRFLPINTILLPRTSSSPHLAPRSLPISWCTPWNTTLRSAPCISSTPL